MSVTIETATPINNTFIGAAQHMLDHIEVVTIQQRLNRIAVVATRVAKRDTLELVQDDCDLEALRMICDLWDLVCEDLCLG